MSASTTARTAAEFKVRGLTAELINAIANRDEAAVNANAAINGNSFARISARYTLTTATAHYLDTLYAHADAEATLASS